MVNLTQPIWVLLYLIDSDNWWPSSAPHDPNFFPDVHTCCFDNQEDAEAHRLKMSDPSKYWVHKTYLQKRPETPADAI